MTAEILPFDGAQVERASDEPMLIVDVDGFEGPPAGQSSDTILFTAWAGDEFRERDGNSLLVMREEDVLAVVD